MGVEIYNARIADASLYIEDHDILTISLDLEINGYHQSFGGYNLQAGGKNYCAIFVRGILDILDVREWNKVKGQYCRVRYNNGKGVGCGNRIDAIGHIMKDQWFDPSEEMK